MPEGLASNGEASGKEQLKSKGRVFFLFRCSSGEHVDTFYYTNRISLYHSEFPIFNECKKEFAAAFSRRRRGCVGACITTEI